jgi:hypothetical protein
VYALPGYGNLLALAGRRALALLTYPTGPIAVAAVEPADASTPTLSLALGAFLEVVMVPIGTFSHYGHLLYRSWAFVARLAHRAPTHFYIL